MLLLFRFDFFSKKNRYNDCLRTLVGLNVWSFGISMWAHFHLSRSNFECSTVCLCIHGSFVNHRKLNIALATYKNNFTELAHSSFFFSCFAKNWINNKARSLKMYRRPQRSELTYYQARDLSEWICSFFFLSLSILLAFLTCFCIFFN